LQVALIPFAVVVAEAELFQLFAVAVEFLAGVGVPAGTLLSRNAPARLHLVSGGALPPEASLLMVHDSRA